MSKKIDTNLSPSRRTIVKGAAWSVPVVAASISAPMAAASGTADLVPTLSGLITLSAGIPLVANVSVNVVDTLTIQNIGSTATQASGTTATIMYQKDLLKLNIIGAGVRVIPGDGSYTLELPSIPPQGSLKIALGTTLVSLLSLGVSALQQIRDSGPKMVATVDGDDATGNNYTDSNIGITINLL